jgi:hypothetical protein
VLKREGGRQISRER